MSRLHVSPALARRIEAAVGRATAAVVAAHAGEGLDAIEVAGGRAFFTGVDSPVTKAEGLGMNGPVTEADLDRVEAFFAERGAASRVTVCPYADKSLPTLLGARGYRIVEMEQVFVRPLAASESFDAPRVDVAIVEGRERDLWGRTIAQGFAEKDDPEPEHLRIMELFARTPEIECFLARVDGEPAGGGALMRVDGIASLFCAATRPAFRGRGVQTAALTARLAAAEGCDVAVVMTMPGSASHRNVERAGFQVAYTKIELLAASSRGA